MRRREFITVLGGASLAWPIAAQAQQHAMPVVGWLASASADGGWISRVSFFREGLKEGGYVEGQNVLVEYRWADDHNDRLPILASDLVNQHVSVMVSGGGTSAALAAKAATTVIPIVFHTAGDPVRAGIVANLNHPGGNITGVVGFTDQLITKRMELLGELVPHATTMGALLNPKNPNFTNRSKDMVEAARLLGRELRIVLASDSEELDKAFASAIEQKVGALVVQADAVFIGHRDQIVTLAARNTLPAIYENREDVAAGGLVSYGPSIAEEYRLLGRYTAKILHGENPGDLPVMQPTQINLIINLRTAKTLDLEIPMSLLMRVKEVIE